MVSEIKTLRNPNRSALVTWTPKSLSFELIEEFCADTQQDLIRTNRLLAYRGYVAGIANLKAALLVAPNGIVVDSENNIHEYLNWYSGKESKKIDKLRRGEYQNLFSKSQVMPKVLRGRTLSLLSHWGNLNWGHFVLDSIGRLATLSDSSLELSDFDQILIPTFPGAHAQILLRSLFPAELNLVQVGDARTFFVEDLTVPTIPGYNRVYSSELPNFYKNIATRTPTFDRVFVSRNDFPRKFLVQEEMRRELNNFGIVTIDPISLETPWTAFSTANVIVGVHGASMAGLVFGKVGCRYVEITPRYHQYPYFESIAISAGMTTDTCYGTSGIVRDYVFTWSLFKKRSQFSMKPSEFDIQNLLKLNTF